MSLQWITWNLDDMQDAADEEGYVGMTALAVREHTELPVLPYYGALVDYRDHVGTCAVCGGPDLKSCAQGDGLSGVARVGVDEQHRMAEMN